MPVDWVDAVSEPSVAPVPAEGEGRCSRGRGWRWSETSIRAAVPDLVVARAGANSRGVGDAPDAAPAPMSRNTTVEPFEEESVDVAATVSSGSCEFCLYRLAIDRGRDRGGAQGRVDPLDPPRLKPVLSITAMWLAEAALIVE